MTVMIKFLTTTTLLAIIFIGCNDEKRRQIADAPVYGDELLQQTRQAAYTVPGSLPVSINYVKYGESRKRCSDVTEGATDDTCVLARTAFQIVYADGWIMVDAGMDRQVHEFFERDVPQPYFEDKAAQIEVAVNKARLIVVTHEHGDHVAGVIHRKDVDSVNYKTILTTEQVNTLINDPQLPEIELTEEQSQKYMITDFFDMMPVAPGVVLIKAPGHTKGEVMVYAKLQSGKEFLFTGDVSWSYEGITKKKLKPASERKRVGENSENIEKQLAWINDLMVNKKFTVLVSHDNVMLPQFAANGIIGDSLQLTTTGMPLPPATR